MGEIVSIISQKGGVGKTTTAVNLCASLASLDYKVLLLDLDPQGHISTSFGYSNYDLNGSIEDVLHGSRCLEDVIHQTQLENFHFIPYLLEDQDNCFIAPLKEQLLKNLLLSVKSYFDFIFIDCPSSLNNAAYHALIASDSIIVPIQCEYYALKALSNLLKQIKFIKSQYNPDLRYRGFLLTMMDMRNNLSKRVVNKVRNTLKELVFETMIPRNIKLAEVPYYGKPAILFDKSSKGAQSYLNLAHELLSQNGTYDSSLTKRVTAEVIQ